MVMLDEYLRPIEQGKRGQSEGLVRQHYLIIEIYKDYEQYGEIDHDD